eukprot:scaffold38413_cov16-Prasinocladus_malaysianus.AAC.1
MAGQYIDWAVLSAVLATCAVRFCQYEYRYALVRYSGTGLSWKKMLSWSTDQGWPGTSHIGGYQR